MERFICRAILLRYFVFRYYSGHSRSKGVLKKINNKKNISHNVCIKRNELVLENYCRKEKKVDVCFVNSDFKKSMFSDVNVNFFEISKFVDGSL